jgi:hypothetical protein
MTIAPLSGVRVGYIREAGAVRIVLAGVIEIRFERDRYQDGLGVPLSMCRFLVDLPLVRA